MSYVYLASPYTHKDESVMEMRYNEMVNVVKTCLEFRLPVYSPIVHWHMPSITMGPDRPIDFEAFQIQDIALITGCYEFWVITLPGWEHSKGCNEEMKFAAGIGKTTRLANLDALQHLCIYTRKGLEKQLSSLSEKLLEKMKSGRDYHSLVTPEKSKTDS